MCLVIVVVFVVFQVWPRRAWVVGNPRAAAVGGRCTRVVLLLGTFCARFRDILPIVSSVMQIAFFVTPVIWKPEQLGKGQALLWLNPFFDLLEIVPAAAAGRAAGRGHLARRLAVTVWSCGVSPGACSRARAGVSRSGCEPTAAAVSTPHILIEGVSVFFPLYHGNARSLKKTVLAAASGRLGQDRQHRVVVQALRDISFSLTWRRPARTDRLQRGRENHAAAHIGRHLRAGDRPRGRARQPERPVGFQPWHEHGVDRPREHHAARSVQRPAADRAWHGWSRMWRSSPAWATFWTFRCASTRLGWWSAWASLLPPRSGPRSC